MPRVLLFVPNDHRAAAGRLLPGADWSPHGRGPHWLAAADLPTPGVMAGLRAACPGIVYLGRLPTETTPATPTAAPDGGGNQLIDSHPEDPPLAEPGRAVPADATRSEEPVPATPPPPPEPTPAPVELSPEPAGVPAVAPESVMAAPLPPPAPAPPPAAKTPAWQALLKKKA